jgi:hypothetical protein
VRHFKTIDEATRHRVWQDFGEPIIDVTARGRLAREMRVTAGERIFGEPEGLGVHKAVLRTRYM